MLTNPNEEPRYIIVKLAPNRHVIARRSVRKGWWHSLATVAKEHDANALIRQLNETREPNADQA